MNYYTLVTPEDGMPCTNEEAVAIREALKLGADCDCGEAEDGHASGCSAWDPVHGFEFELEGGLGYLQAEENGNWGELPEPALLLIGKLIAKAKKPHWEFGAAFSASRMVAGSHGGTAFRIYPDGVIVERAELWPERP